MIPKTRHGGIRENIMRLLSIRLRFVLERPIEEVRRQVHHPPLVKGDREMTTARVRWLPVIALVAGFWGLGPSVSDAGQPSRAKVGGRGGRIDADIPTWLRGRLIRMALGASCVRW